MLPQKNKLTVNRFNQFIQKPDIFKNTSYTLVVKKTNTPDSPKFSITVPKYLDKRSTKRHAAKRMIEEIIRPKLKFLKPSLYILIKAQKIFDKKNTHQTSKELESLLNKLATL